MGYFDVTLMKYCTRIDSSLYHSRDVIKMVFMRLWKLKFLLEIGNNFYFNLFIFEFEN